MKGPCGLRPESAAMAAQGYTVALPPSHEACSERCHAQVVRRAWWHRRWQAKAVGLLLGLCATVALVAWLSTSKRRLRSHVDEYVEMDEELPQPNCSVTEEGVAYWTRQETVRKIEGVHNEAMCRRHCAQEPRCMVWTYGRKTGRVGLRSICFLLALEQGEQPTREQMKHVVSGGLPCNMTRIQQPGSIFCFTLISPTTSEQLLLEVLHVETTGIFGCDAYAVYSNVTFEVVPGVVSHPVNSDLACRSGGEPSALANLDIFMAVWKEVAKAGQFKEHNWTVKADADTVFLPGRLRSILPHHPEAKQGVYLNNCRFGMRGAIEVFSRNAVEAWISGAPACFQHFTESCVGPCGWGEDTFLDRCLQQVLKIRRDDEWRLLSDSHCVADRKQVSEWVPERCRSDRVAFHPFREKESLSDCLSWTMQRFRSL